MSRGRKALDELTLATDDLDLEERRAFDDFLLGWVAGSVPAGVWRMGLDAARRDVERRREGRS